MHYRLDEVGWLQFERLCTEVLSLESGLAPDLWEGRADKSRRALIQSNLTAPVEQHVLLGPVLVLAIWVRPGESRDALAAVPDGLARTARSREFRSMLVLTNLDQLVVPEVTDCRVRIVGPRELGELIDARPALRQRLPFLLGICDLDRLIDAEAFERSTADVGAAAELARVFVPTNAHARTLALLGRHHFAVLTGPPEMGKTAIARMIALAQMASGWEAHECIRPEQLWEAHKRDRGQVFVADDAFGSTEYRPEAAERWALELDRVLRAMDERHWLIWTSRPAPLKAGLRRIHREHGTEHFPQPAEVQVDAANLDVEEKALILFRHAKAARLPVQAIGVVQTHGWEIVDHAHFTPERIRRFVSDRLPALADGSGSLADAVAAEIREPTTAMAASLHALGPEHRALLVALLDTPPGPVPERELAAAVRRHFEQGFARAPSDLVDRLTDHFLRVVPPMSVTWVHPSWRDLLIEDLAENPEACRHFLASCSLDGILLALSVGGGAAGERVFPLMTDDAAWDTLADRVSVLLPELADPDLFRLLAGLTAALDAPAEEPIRAEVRSLAATALALTRGAEMTVALLAEWHNVAARIDDSPPPPEVARIWIETLPTPSLDIEAAGELARLDEWVTLVGVLSEHAPRVLGGFGFPWYQRAALDALVDRAESLAKLPEASETAAALLRALRRLERYGGLSEYQALHMRLATRLMRSREWLPAEPTPVATARDLPPPESSIVARVLRDLDP